VKNAVAHTNGTRAALARVTTDAEFLRRRVPAHSVPLRLRPSQLPIGAAVGLSAAGMRPSRVPVASFRPAGSARTAVQRICAECEDEEKKQVQSKSTPSQAASTGVVRERSPVLDVVGKGGGQPLAPRVRAEMEGLLGTGFPDVRIHTDAKAAQSAAAISAEAYTAGEEIVFSQGSFAPERPDGRHTLAHELAHVVQQRKGPVSGTDTGTGLAVSDPSDSFEQEAESAASRAAHGPQRLSVHSSGSAPEGEARRIAAISSRPGVVSHAAAADGKLRVQRQAPAQPGPEAEQVGEQLLRIIARGPITVAK
jgi:Domain of unknown function (DUF4157)